MTLFHTLASNWLLRSVEAERHAKSADPNGGESLSHGVGGDVSDESGLGPTCEAVHTGKEVAVACRGWQGTDEVDVDVVESLRERREGAGRRLSVSRQFGGLAVSASASPQSDVLADPLPDEARRHHAL